jgi:hypothetical protein
MSSSTSFFSHARPGKFTSKKVRGFLALPGEVRNQVYGYYFDCEIRCEIAAKGAQFKGHKTRTVKLWAGAFQTNSYKLKYASKATEEDLITIRISRPLGKYNIVQGLQTNWFASLFALNLICKQIHAETLPFLYQTTIFVFNASNRILNFLNVVSRPKLEHITKLQLHYTTYGIPALYNDRKWQDKHNESWICACSAASRKLAGLRSLKIWIRVVHLPLRMNLRQPWILPILQFRRLTQMSQKLDVLPSSSTPTQQQAKLQTVNVDFRSSISQAWFAGNHQLAKASQDLHHLFGHAIELAILGAKEEVAMAAFNAAWEGEYAMWQNHLGYGKTGW